jgi:hypothetical protein
MVKFRLFLLLCFLPIFMFAQSEKNDFGIKFSGYIKTDFFYDTRQTVNIREGHFLLYPSPKSMDAENNDINAKPNFNFLSIQTRLTGSISAPDAFGAKINGVIEADFFGNENANFVDANGFRLRHAYAKMSWGTTELLFGQYWHPLFIPACFSDVISFNTGAPFQPFSRNPQIRITQKFNNFSMIGVAAAQRDFTSPGGSTALRNSSIPELQGQIQYESKSTDGKEEILAGLGGGYKSLIPQLNSEKNGKKYVTDESIGGFSSTAFLKIKNSSITFKLQGVYGQNLFDLTMLGGYAISEILDTNKNSVKYTPINTLSGWSELIYNIDNISLALWAGYTQNLGSNDKILSYTNKVGGTDVTLRGTAVDNSSAIKSILRISPRVVLTSVKFNFAFEIEYTSAAYAIQDNTGRLHSRDEYGKITITENTSNTRALFSVILKF